MAFRSPAPVFGSKSISTGAAVVASLVFRFIISPAFFAVVNNRPRSPLVALSDLLGNEVACHAVALQRAPERERLPR